MKSAKIPSKNSFESIHQCQLKYSKKKRIEISRFEESLWMTVAKVNMSVVHSVTKSEESMWERETVGV